MPTAAITSIPKRIVQRTNPDPITLYNNGANTVYVDVDNPPSTQSQPINPGATLIWTSLQCYAVTAAGLKGSLVMSTNVGNLDDPSAIATALIASGLAAAIATAINADGVPITNNPNVQIGDNPTTLYHGVTIGGTIVNVVDVSTYQSLEIDAQEGTPGSNVQITVQWWADAGATTLLSTDIITGTASVFAQLACKSQFVQVATVITPGGNDYIVNVVASYRALSVERYQNFPDAVLGQVIYNDCSLYHLQQAVANGASITDNICSRNGTMQVLVVTNAVLTFQIQDVVAGTTLFEWVTTATGVAFPFTFRVPKLALRIKITNASGAAATPTVNISFPD